MEANLRSHQRGLTFPELLVVVALMGLAAMVAVPRIIENVRFAQARGFAEQLELSMRAVRMIAVTTQSTQNLSVEPCSGASCTAAGFFRYTNLAGNVYERPLPPNSVFDGLAAPMTIAFEPNGSVQGGPAEVRVKARVSAGVDFTDRWSIRVNMVGNTGVAHEKIDPPESGV